MKNSDIHIIIELLENDIKQWQEPVVGEVAHENDPFKVLIATILSLRTKDETTRVAALKLFEHAETPDKMLVLGKDKVARLIYPVGFYSNKAATIMNICRTLLEKYGGTVPDDIDELLKLKGVGRKTANLVVTLAYNKPGICVDIHVHRISNRLGYVNTKTPDETEYALRKKLPQKYWIRYNDLLVTFGQNLCRPVSPFCSKCSLLPYCDRREVKQSR